MIRKSRIVFIAMMLFLTPSASYAATLSSAQVNAIMQLLTAFNVDAVVIAKVEAQLRPQGATTIQSAPSAPAQTPQTKVQTASSTSQSVNTLEPASTSPIDRIPPQIVRHNRSIGGNNVSWPDPNFPGYGSTHKSCTDCLLIVNDEPTSIVITYFDYDDVTANLSSENKVLWGESEVNAKTQAIDNQLKIEPSKILNFTDAELKKEHVISYDSLGLQSSKTYMYRFEAKDGTGNTYKQEFRGSYGLPIMWSLNQTLKR